MKKIFKNPFIWFLLGLLAYLPYYLAFFPGILTPDSVWQTRQALGLVPLNSQHPVLHTLLIRLLVGAGQYLFGSVNAGVALYTAVQCVCLALINTYVLVVLRRNHLPAWTLVLLWLFFFLCPYCAEYAVTMWKDVLFSAALLMLSVYVWDTVRHDRKWNFGRNLVFILLSLAVCLLRTNGIGAWVLFVIAFLIARFRTAKHVLPGIAVTVAGVVCLSGPVSGALGVEKASPAEAVSIPLQQAAYTVIWDEADGYGPANPVSDEDYEAGKGRVSKEQYEILGELLDTEKIWSTYRPDLADPMKNLMNAGNGPVNLSAQPFRYLDVWLRIGLRNPQEYFDAWYSQTYGYYAPTVGTETSYVSEVQENDLGIVRVSLVPYGFLIFMYNVLNNFTRLYDMVWCPAFSFYVVAAAFLIALFRKIVRRFTGCRKNHDDAKFWMLKTAFVYILPLGLLATVLVATPVASDLRYVWALFLGAPVYVLMAFAPAHPDLPALPPPSMISAPGAPAGPGVPGGDSSDRGPTVQAAPTSKSLTAAENDCGPTPQR